MTVIPGCYCEMAFNLLSNLGSLVTEHAFDYTASYGSTSQYILLTGEFKLVKSCGLGS